MRKILPKLLILSGILLFVVSGYFIWERVNPYRLNFEPFSQLTTNNSQLTSSLEYPSSITIPALKVDLPLIPSKINGKVWESTKKGISYLASSPLPGAMGNSILYGHNFANLLGALPKIKPGDGIYIRYNDGEVKKFIVDSTQIVKSSNSSVLNPTSDRRITLYTCVGFLDSKRFVASVILSQ